ncbi:MAG: DUF6056 family protein [Clostridium sp.]|uniref:DUF6056 family protein n=1 Tax=Clostridium sp. TaxID=1506 RepID=UPI003F37E473
MKKKLYIAVFGILYLRVLYLFPYTADDLFWGSSAGMKQLHHFFYGYNGRYLGNSLVMIITRSVALKIFVMMLCFALIGYFASKLIQNERNKSILLLTLGAILVLMPRELLMQSIVWTAGFSNYIPPVVIILIYLNIIRKYIFDDSKECNSKLTYVLAFILSVSSSLFVEHVTCYNVAMSIVILIFAIIKCRKLIKLSITYMIGAFLGFLIMFQNPAYHQMVQGNYSGRAIDKASMFTKAISQLFVVIYKQLIFFNVFLNLLLAIIITLVLIKKFKEKKHRILGSLIIIYLFSFVIFSGYYYFTYYMVKFNGVNYDWSRGPLAMIGLISSIIFYFVLVLVPIIYFKKNNKLVALFFILSIGVVTIPLFIVHPIGPRCFAPMYIFFGMYIATVINELDTSNIVRNLLLIFLLALNIIGFFNLFRVYTPIHKLTVDRAKVQEIQVKEGNTNIYIPDDLPNNLDNDYVWYWRPSVWNENYKEFYNIPMNDKLVTMPYSQWMQKYGDIIKYPSIKWPNN